MVTGSSLAAEDDSARSVVTARSVFDPVVGSNHVEHIEQLSLVLVYTFDLAIKERIGIHTQIYAAPLVLLRDNRTELLFIGAFYFPPLLQKSGLIGQRYQFLQLEKVG